MIVDEELNHLGRNNVACQQLMIKRSAVTVAKETLTGHTWIFAIFVLCCSKHVSDKLNTSHLKDHIRE